MHRVQFMFAYIASLHEPLQHNTIEYINQVVLAKWRIDKLTSIKKKKKKKKFFFLVYDLPTLSL